MSNITRSLIWSSILSCLLLAMGTTVQAQSLDSYSRLGLSAAPDAYVPELTIQPDETFVLYVIAVGPHYGPLPFDVAETLVSRHRTGRFPVRIGRFHRLVVA